MKFMLCAIIVIFLLHETVGSWFDFEVLVSLLTCFNVAFGCSDCTKCKRFFHFASLLALTLWCLGGFGDFRKKTAVFGCLTNALAPPPIAPESCSTAQTHQPV